MKNKGQYTDEALAKHKEDAMKLFKDNQEEIMIDEDAQMKSVYISRSNFVAWYEDRFNFKDSLEKVYMKFKANNPSNPYTPENVIVPEM